ncbi:HemK2/MTQ2 family protein methyltransferase [Streptomyces sp. NPDC032161]|uniref:HemK2/MTQ2 family protein methyltransferase n=1 Tax=unclassified Streptomyces TaxID=2593676 RepID=UPI0033E3BBFA
MADGLVDSSMPLLVKPPGVYAPQRDTRLLMAALDQERVRPGAAVLDIGTGSGVLAIRAAQLGGKVTAVDITRRAVLTARLNALLHLCRITVRRSDLTSAVRARTFDLVLCNPPYVPAPAAEIPRRGAARSWDAGTDGRAVVDRVCEAAPAMLRRGGVLLMVHSGLCDPCTTLERLDRVGLKATVSNRVHIPLGPVLLSRESWLRERELLEGERKTEELVVIRAERT